MATTILIVDDSKLARIVMARVIRALQPDWVRLEVEDAAKALTVVSLQQIDVALIDYNMPDTNGLTLAAELRKRFPNMPIALVTANTRDDIVAEARGLSATFIAKPINEDGMRGFLSGAALRLRRNT